MIAHLALLPSRRGIRGLDVAAVVTVIVFAALGAVAGVELARLSTLSASLLDAAAALDQVARTLDALGQVPVVGSSLDPLAEDVRRTATSTQASGVQTAAALRTLAIVIGVAIAVIPLPPLLGVYLPLRGARAREVRGLRRLLAAGRPVDEMLVAHLAHGAVARLPYAQLRRVSGDPWADLNAGRHQRLAAAELRRLGVSPPSAWADARASAAGRERR